MDTKDLMVIKGHILFELFDENMELKAKCDVDNLVTAVGDRLYASRGGGLTTSALPTGMKLGTGSTAVAKTGAGAALVTYLATSNQPFDATFPSEAAGVITYKTTWAPGEATTASPITEAVIVTEVITNDDTSTAAETIARALVTGIPSKGSLDTLVGTWTHTLLGA
jgi:hypothetical protein